ncbi:hypothetical protein [Clostridium niameyense]|uniref:hypothetical protein n=1 Tax=Clostridium niameyense TaxID=1622073 RepID=UPI00067EFB73|nr:hypothetical protein [Clostridium niameyense]
MSKKMEALITANEYMENLKKGINTLIEYIQLEEENRAFSLIPSISEGIGWIMEVINLTSDIQKEPIDISIMDEKLEEIVQAIENEDYVLIGDLFNYEILPILNDVHAKIKNIILN